MTGHRGRGQAKGGLFSFVKPCFLLSQLSPASPARCCTPPGSCLRLGTAIASPPSSLPATGLTSGSPASDASLWLLLCVFSDFLLIVTRLSENVKIGLCSIHQLSHSPRDTFSGPVGTRWVLLLADVCLSYTLQLNQELLEGQVHSSYVVASFPLALGKMSLTFIKLN